MTELFDIEGFQNNSVDGANATKMIPVPEAEYAAVIKSIAQPRIVQTKRGDSVVLDIVWEPQDETGSIKAATGRDGATVRQSLWLDIGPDGKLATGEGVNIGLGRLRAALGQNKPGKVWSPSQLINGAARISVGHEPRKEDPGILDARVNKVAAL